jgi:hypothetical protein
LTKIIKNPQIGIVIQGPIRHDFDFTLQTVTLYLTNFQESPIVLSTWDDEDISAFLTLAAENSNFYIVTQSKPSNPGIRNINLQISSTLAGLKKLEALKSKYAIKTRTDQCFFDPLALVKLKNAYTIYSKEQRILVLSLNSFLFRPYGASDLFQFGLIEILVEFWSASPDSRLPVDNFVFTASSNLREYAKKEICEVYLTTNFLRRKGEVLDFSLHNSLLMYRKYFIILDTASIDLVWDKYTSHSNRWNQTSFPKPFQEISEGLWLSLESEMGDLSRLDYLLDMAFVNQDFLDDKFE